MRTILRLLALVAFAVALGSSTLALTVALGCANRLDKTGPYNGNGALYATDASISAAYSVLDVFMKFQFENRTSLPAEVNDFADKTRRDAPQWSKRIIALRDAYAASPTPESKKALDTVLRLVRAAVVQASDYLVSQPTVSTP